MGIIKDSGGHTDLLETKLLIRNAFQLLVTDETVKKIVIDTIDTALNPEEKSEVRLKAKEFLFSYILPKAKIEMDMTTNGNNINALSPEQLKNALGEIIKNADNTKTERTERSS